MKIGFSEDQYGCVGIDEALNMRELYNQKQFEFDMHYVGPMSV